MDEIKLNIEGLFLKKLNKYSDDKGAVMHFLKSSNDYFSCFGEVYFSLVNKDVVKGWKLHKRIKQNLVVPYGQVEFTLKDLRKNSSSHNLEEVVTIGYNRYYLLQIPSGVCYKFKSCNDSESLVANYINEEYDSSEAVNFPLEITDFPVF